MKFKHYILLLAVLTSTAISAIDGGSSYTAKDINNQMLKEEIGGIAIYLDLLASLLEIDLQEAIVDTFNEKSVKYGFPQHV